MRPLFNQTWAWPAILPLSMLLAFAVVACQMDDPTSGTERLRQKQLTLQASYESPESLTKTSLHSDGHVYWVPGDALSVFYGSGTGGGSRFVATNTEEDRIAIFSGTIDLLTGASEMTLDDVSFWGLYPYDPESSCDGQSVTTSFKADLVGTPDTFTSGAAPSMAKCPGLLLSFRNLYSGLYFTVTKAGFQRVTIRSNGGEKMSGRARFGMDADGVPELKEILSGTDAVTLTAPDGGEFIPGKKYYLIFLPQTLASGFTLEVESTTELGAFTVSSSVPFRRNAISSVVNLDTKATFGYIKINAINFPDARFRQYVLDNIDGDKDELLSKAERDAVTSIDVHTTEGIGDYGIASLQGIGFFTNLENLNCRNNILASLDLSKNKALKALDCSGNLLTGLSLPENIALETLDCSGNELATLDLAANVALKTLDCHGNVLSSLDLTHNTALLALDCHGNSLGGIDITQLASLQSLNIADNVLTALVLTGNMALTNLICDGNLLPALDLSPVAALTDLSCVGNRLTELDLAACPLLEHLYCGGNQIPELNVAVLPELSKLDCTSAQMDYLYMLVSQHLTELIKHEHTIIIYLTDGDGINIVREGYGKNKKDGWN